MSRGNLFLFFAAVALFAFVIFPSSGEYKAGHRVVYWEETSTKEIPLNSTRENVALWMKKKKVENVDPDETHMSINVEHVSGWGFASMSCSDWDVIIDLTFNSFDEVTAKTVRKVGTCL